MDSMSKKGLALLAVIVLVLGAIPFMFNSSDESGEISEELTGSSTEVIDDDMILGEMPPEENSVEADSHSSNDSSNEKDESFTRGTGFHKTTPAMTAGSSKTTGSAKKSNASTSNAASGSVSFAVKAGTKGGPSLPGKTPEGAISSMEDNQPEILAVKKDPCLKSEFKSDTSRIKGKLQELTLKNVKVKKNKFCVFVDGKPVEYSITKKGNLRLDWKLSQNKAEITALYCNEGKKCDLVCPEIEKDFWDTIGESKTEEASVGFSDSATSEERALQKELKELKDVLNRKPAKAVVALWKVDSSVGVQCQK